MQVFHPFCVQQKGNALLIQHGLLCTLIQQKISIWGVFYRLASLPIKECVTYFEF